MHEDPARRHAALAARLEGAEERRRHREIEPGVLAEIATVFSAQGVSVEALTQSAGTIGADGTDATATLVIGTHEATEAALAATVTALSTNQVVRSVVSVLRVEGL